MFSWLEYEILALPGTEYMVLLGMLVVVFGYLSYYSYGAFKRYRFMDGTATSKIRSAAQGHVELKGLAEWMPQDSIHSPFSNSRCVWYHCTIDKKSRTGKRTTWSNISDDRSSAMFQLVDETGDCIIDPDDAHVIPETDLTWYGHSTDYSTRPPKRSSWLSFSLGSYRFRERLILPASRLYALGWFRTVHSNPSDEYVSKQVEDLVKQWKIQPQRYLGEYDLDQNGKIQKNEWKVIRAAARKQVLAKINSEKSEQHVMSRPQHSRQPYILSVTPEEELVARKKFKAYFSVSGAFMAFATITVLISLRAPF